MSTLDSQYRIIIPAEVLRACVIDLNEEVFLYHYTDYKPNALLLTNRKNLELKCFGVLIFDNKSRFCLHKEIRSEFNITKKTKLSIYGYAGQLVIELL